MSRIEIRDLHFSYTDGRQDVPALNGVELRVEAGEFLCLIGPSGCGKSTLLRMLAGLEKPESGTVCVDGTPITDPSSDRMIVFQDYALFPWMTAEKNVAFALRHGRNMPRQEAARMAQTYLQKVGMDHAAERYPFQLSGGMRQRVAIARALAMDPEILLLDEPFGALDTKNRTEIQQLLLDLWQRDTGRKKTVVFVTHDLEEAILLADRVAFMDAGRIRATVTLELPRPREPMQVAHWKQRLTGLFEGRTP